MNGFTDSTDSAAISFKSKKEMIISNANSLGNEQEKANDSIFHFLKVKRSKIASQKSLLLSFYPHDPKNQFPVHQQEQ